MTWIMTACVAAIWGASLLSGAAHAHALPEAKTVTDDHADLRPPLALNGRTIVLRKAALAQPWLEARLAEILEEAVRDLADLEGELA